MAGPESPPRSICAALSRRSPPRCLAGPWHDTQRESMAGGNSAVSSGVAQLHARLISANRLFTGRTCERAGRIACVD